MQLACSWRRLVTAKSSSRCQLHPFEHKCYRHQAVARSRQTKPTGKIVHASPCNITADHCNNRSQQLSPAASGISNDPELSSLCSSYCASPAAAMTTDALTWDGLIRAGEMPDLRSPESGLSVPWPDSRLYLDS